MVDDSAQYEFKGAVTLRGMEAPTIAKWQTEGWELIAQKPGRVRMQLMFRRPKPKTTGEQLAAAWAGFRRLRPAAQAGIAGAGGMVLAGLVAGIVAIAISESGPGSGGGGGGAVAAAATPAAAVAVTAEPSVKPVAVESTPKPERILTKKNNEDLAALLKLTDPADELVGEFAQQYAGRTIAFNGNIAYVTNADDYTSKECDVLASTACDLLVGSGNYSETSSMGPNFKISDADPVQGLHLTGADVPDTITIGRNVRIIAEVGEYNSVQELFQLTPVSIRFR